MSKLKEIITELCAHTQATPPNLNSVWSKDTINHIRNAARQTYVDQELESGVRDDMTPGFGDIRYDDPGQYNHGMDAYHDAEEDIGFEFEETLDANDVYDEIKPYADADMGAQEIRQLVAAVFADHGLEVDPEVVRTVLMNLGREESEECGSFNRLRDMANYSSEEQEDDMSDEEMSDEQVDDEIDDMMDDDGSSMDGEQFGDELDEPQEWDDPNYQGVIRTVPDAHLVYKRQQEDGTFNELWQYNIGKDFRKELETRRAILAGTDIPVTKMASPDNTQTYELWTAGNCQLLNIRGLPN